MTAIQIIPTDFRAAPALMQLLQRRRAALVAQAPGAKADVLVVSAQREAALGGAKGLAELARGAGAKTLVVVAEDAATFALQPEMGGRLLRVARPAAPAHLAPLRQSDLLALADVVGGLVSPMVAGDAATGTLIDLGSRPIDFRHLA